MFMILDDFSLVFVNFINRWLVMDYLFLDILANCLI